jgi:hypothetical protein
VGIAALIETEEGQPTRDFIEHARREVPRECGGFLVERYADGKKAFVPCRNMDPNPKHQCKTPIIDRIRAGSPEQPGAVLRERSSFAGDQNFIPNWTLIPLR